LHNSIEEHVSSLISDVKAFASAHLDARSGSGMTGWGSPAFATTAAVILTTTPLSTHYLGFLIPQPHHSQLTTSSSSTRLRIHKPRADV